MFKDLPAGVKNEGDIAVVVGNQGYLGDLPDNPDGKADADAVMAQQENIIDLRDAALTDFERVFGSASNPEGELAERINKKDPSEVFIYVASHGAALFARRQLGEPLREVDDLDAGRFFDWQSLIALVDLMSEDLGKAIMALASYAACARDP